VLKQKPINALVIFAQNNNLHVEDFAHFVGKVVLKKLQNSA